MHRARAVGFCILYDENLKNRIVHACDGGGSPFVTGGCPLLSTLYSVCQLSVRCRVENCWHAFQNLNLCSVDLSKGRPAPWSICAPSLWRGGHPWHLRAVSFLLWSTTINYISWLCLFFFGRVFQNVQEVEKLKSTRTMRKALHIKLLFCFYSSVHRWAVIVF